MLMQVRSSVRRREVHNNLITQQTKKRAKDEGEVENAQTEKGGVCVCGFHLIYTSTVRIYNVQSESEVLVKVVKMKHAVRILH
jgi:hypothetical protein